MSTSVYGESDDLIEFEGDVSGEVGAEGASDDPVLVVFSDGTVIEASYGKGPLGVWKLTVVRRGNLFSRLEECDSEDARPHSDVVHFDGGLKWAYASKSWERVQ